MKRFVSILTAGSLLALVPAIPGPAFAGTDSGNTQLVALCKAGADAFPLEPQGGCVSVLTTNRLEVPGFYTHICQFFMINFPDTFYAAYDKLSECVRDGGDGLN